MWLYYYVFATVMTLGTFFVINLFKEPLEHTEVNYLETDEDVEDINEEDEDLDSFQMI